MNRSLATEPDCPRLSPVARDRGASWRSLLGPAPGPKRPLASRARAWAPPSADSSRSRLNDTTTLTSLGWDARLGADYERHDRPDQRPARVSRIEPGVCTLLGRGGASRASLSGRMLAVAARDAARLPCPGDWVVVRTWPDARRTVEAVLPRRGIVWRTPGSRPTASNVDFMITIDGMVDADQHLVDALRALAAPGRTIGLVGADPRAHAAVMTALAGAALLPPAGAALVPLPDGGAVIDILQTHRTARPRSGSHAACRGHDSPGAGTARLDDSAAEHSEHMDIHWHDLDVPTLNEPRRDARPAPMTDRPTHQVTVQWRPADRSVPRARSAGASDA